MKTGPRGRTGEERRRPADPAGSDGRAEPAVRTQRSDRLCIILYIYIYIISYIQIIYSTFESGQLARLNSESVPSRAGPTPGRGSERLGRAAPAAVTGDVTAAIGGRYTLDPAAQGRNRRPVERASFSRGITYFIAA